MCPIPIFFRHIFNWLSERESGQLQTTMVRAPLRAEQKNLGHRALTSACFCVVVCFDGKEQLATLANVLISTEAHTTRRSSRLKHILLHNIVLRDSDK